MVNYGEWKIKKSSSHHQPDQLTIPLLLHLKASAPPCLCCWRNGAATHWRPWRRLQRSKRWRWRHLSTAFMEFSWDFMGFHGLMEFRWDFMKFLMGFWWDFHADVVGLVVSLDDFHQNPLIWKVLQWTQFLGFISSRRHDIHPDGCLLPEKWMVLTV